MHTICSVHIFNQYVCVTELCIFVSCLSSCVYVYILLLIKEMEMYPKSWHNLSTELYAFEVEFKHFISLIDVKLVYYEFMINHN